MSRYEPPVPRRTTYVTSADGIRIHVEEHGPQDAPTVVLSHGWTCSTLFWAPVIRGLADDLRVIAYDQRGHGRSTTPANSYGYTTDALADDLCVVLDAEVPASGRAVLAGHSMGGMTLMAAAARPALQERAAAALLCSTGGSGLVDESRLLPPWVKSQRIQAGFDRFLLHSRMPLGPVNPLGNAALKYGIMGAGSTKEQVRAAARIVHACKPAPRAGWGRVLETLDLDAGIDALTMPTAVIVGTADKLTPPVHAHRMAARLPNCTGLTELAGLGHMTPLEDPDALVDVIRGLVRDHLGDERTQESRTV
ncbi:alpha/beta hydrolase [Streptomyces sp. RB6PN25]|uniref:Alpha/beta hydrolase n=1 Tax=Streptomyces humicola TaxID=2953240 RepID=A0ABT1PSB5_9ACTN|nr:alpha/beta hydrolase [Streptomyces humicola]MCQ4080566.1 alpha/beta hydrolase [Streptomyces humicola]